MVEPSAPLCATISVPLLTVAVPVKELAPLKIRVPLLVTATLPPMPKLPVIASEPAPATVSA